MDAHVTETNTDKTFVPTRIQKKISSYLEWIQGEFETREFCDPQPNLDFYTPHHEIHTPYFWTQLRENRATFLSDWSSWIEEAINADERISFGNVVIENLAKEWLEDLEMMFIRVTWNQSTATYEYKHTWYEFARYVQRYWCNRIPIKPHWIPFYPYVLPSTLRNMSDSMHPEIQSVSTT